MAAIGVFPYDPYLWETLFENYNHLTEREVAAQVAVNPVRAIQKDLLNGANAFIARERYLRWREHTSSFWHHCEVDLPDWDTLQGLHHWVDVLMDALHDADVPEWEVFFSDGVQMHCLLDSLTSREWDIIHILDNLVESSPPGEFLAVVFHDEDNVYIITSPTTGQRAEPRMHSYFDNTMDGELWGDVETFILTEEVWDAWKEDSEIAEREMPF